METTIFIPNKIRIGYQDRSGTYTGKLAYVIYYDNKGHIHKEKSWESWRSKKIDPVDLENIPLSGFVLNKKAGDYSGDYGNHRQAYCRVYDPRGFEFEIEIDNLLYILENANSIKGKGLEGEFVYGWIGGDLVLLPTGSPDYIKITSFNNMISKPESIKVKDLVIGGTYKTNKNKEWVYIGKFEKFDDCSWCNSCGDSEGFQYFFYEKDGSFQTVKSISGKVVKTISTDCVENYAELMDKLQEKEFYSPWNKDADVYESASDDYIIDKLVTRNGRQLFINVNNKMRTVSIEEMRKESGKTYRIYNNYWGNSYYSTYHPEEKEMYTFLEEKGRDWMSIPELNEKFHFNILHQYLKNGKERK